MVGKDAVKHRDNLCGDHNVWVVERRKVVECGHILKVELPELMIYWIWVVRQDSRNSLLYDERTPTVFLLAQRKLC